MPKKYNYTKKTGRPSKFDKLNLKQMEMLVLQGFTDAQLCEFFNITEQSLANYKNRHPKFFESLKDWKLEADIKVEKSLYQRAVGYKYDEVTYEKAKPGLGIRLSNDEIQEIKAVESTKVKVVVKEVMPDVTAQIFWLKNRQPDKWRDVQERRLANPDGSPLTLNNLWGNVNDRSREGKEDNTSMAK